MSVMLFLLCSNSLFAQKKEKELKPWKEQFHIAGNRSFTGTGDNWGFSTSVGYSKQMKKRWMLNIEMESQFFKDEEPLFYPNPFDSSRIVNGSMRDNTWGIQLNGIWSYSIINQIQNKLSLGLGGLFRVQSTSVSDSRSIYYPVATGLPIPVIVFEQWEEQTIYAPGAILKLVYDHRISKNIFVGFNSSFQADTDGNNIINSGLRIGYIL